MERVNYAEYSLEELIDVHNNIDASAFPQRAEAVARQIQIKRSNQLPVPGGLKTGSFDEDPIARKTGWGPIEKSGANFKTHSLIRVSPQRMAFKISFLGYLCACLFIGFASVLLVIFAKAFIADGGFDQPISAYIEPVIAIIIFGAGIAVYRKMSLPRVFDRRRGLFWMRRKAPGRHWSRQSPDSAIRLDEIYALQILSELCQSDKNDYYSYELNLVLTSGRRINVVDHGSLRQLRKDGMTLSKFLGKPLWDKSG